MRILVATDQWSPDVIGGSARVAADTARALARRGHEVMVLTMSQSGLDEEEHDAEMVVKRVVRRQGLPRTLADPGGFHHHGRSLRRRSFDVILAHQTTNAAALAYAGVDAPLAFVFHASVVLEMRFLRRHVAGMRRVALYALDPVLVGLERAAVRKSSRILVLSKFSEDLFTSRYPRAHERVRRVGGAVDQGFFAAPADPQTCRARLGIPQGRLLFTARRLEPRMGVDLLLEAVAQLDEQDVVLAIAGTGSLSSELERMIGELGLQRRVLLLGRVSEEDLRSLYVAADLFVLPTVAYEGFGMSTVEALAAGTPALGTAVGATPEIVELLGPEFVVPTADARSLASGIQRVLPLLGPQLRDRARQVAADRFNWDTAIEGWEAALLELSR